MNFASAGQGSATHLNAEKFKLAAGIEATNIPFKGSAEAVTEVLAGRVDYYFSPIAPVIGQIRSGQLVPLAVGSPQRASALPQVPTTAEGGVPGSDSTSGSACWRRPRPHARSSTGCTKRW